jgi:hypothetical protein
MLKVRLVNNSPAAQAREDPLGDVEPKPAGGLAEPVELRTGAAYGWEGRVYYFLGAVRREHVRQFMCAGGPEKDGIATVLTPDQAQARYVRGPPKGPLGLPSSYSGLESSEIVYALRSGDSFLLTSTSRGLRPLAREASGLPDIEAKAREVLGGSPFPKPMSPGDMSRVAGALGLNRGENALLVEPVDPNFPVVLSMCGVNVAAVSRNMERTPRGGDFADEDTRERTQVELLATEYADRISAAGGNMATAHTSTLEDAGGGRFQAAAVNGLDDLPADEAAALLGGVLAHMSNFSRLLVSAKEPLRADGLLAVAAASAGVVVSKSGGGIRYDVAAEAAVYDVARKRPAAPV